MAEISVTELDGGSYRVEVEENGSSSTHTVIVTEEDLGRLPAAPSTAELVEASFRFMLDREPKEAILPKFQLGVISRYFPEYGQEIGEYL